MSEQLKWTQFYKIRAIYLLMLIAFPLPIYFIHNQFQSIALDVIGLLGYGAAIYICTLRPLFKLKCPSCKRQFFPTSGGIIFFPRCASCGIKLGHPEN